MKEKKMYNNSLYGNFRNRKFSDLWSKATDFLADYKDCGVYIESNKIEDSSVLTLFYLLYSEYGNSVIASSDEEQFKYQIFSTIFEYGPTWEKRLDIQSKIRHLTDAELQSGNKQIWNKALNPGVEPSTQALEELQYINVQNTSNVKRGKLDGLMAQYQILNTDVTKDFISKFKKYFLQIVIPELPLWYEEGEN